MLWEGQYLDSNDRCIEVNDDILQFVSIIGLSAEERALLQNYHFMSSRLAGTRQIRSTIRHMVFSSRICYGIPVFLSFTPSERHSGLALRLYRGRRADPAYASFTSTERQCLDYRFPSLRPHDMNDSMGENVVIDLPDYDSRRTITARDPLCCVYAFQVMTRFVLPSLYGFRMCPNCPHCATAETPCMDFFGSNATPMGGAAGRADAMLAAVEAQKAEGVLHIHLFIWFQMVAQFSTLLELG